jgi:hypothetical protein
MRTDYRVTNNRRATGLSCLQGYIVTQYDSLVEKLGEPILGSGDGKVSAEWIIKFNDGKVATIYDYKEKTTPKETYDWHIGGNSREVVRRVEEIMENYAVREA